MKRFMGFQLESHPATHANECNSNWDWSKQNLRPQNAEKLHGEGEREKKSLCILNWLHRENETKQEPKSIQMQQNNNKIALAIFLSSFFFSRKEIQCHYRMRFCIILPTHTTFFLLFFKSKQWDAYKIMRCLLWLRARVVSLKRFCCSKWLVNCEKSNKNKLKRCK